MQTGFASVYTVVAICIDLHLELFASLHKSFGIFRSVTVMNIVVCRAVNNQQVAVKFSARVMGLSSYPAEFSLGVRM